MHITGVKMAVFALNLQKNRRKNLAIFPQPYIPLKFISQYHVSLNPANCLNFSAKCKF